MNNKLKTNVEELFKVKEEYKNWRLIDVDFRVVISDSRIEIFYSPLRPGSKEYLDKLGEIGKKLVEKLMAIEGVLEVHISLYWLQVGFAELFTREEMIPQVSEVIKEVLESK